MRERYTYEISVNDDDRWKQEILADDTFHREPRAIARSLLEGWVIDNPGRAGGERIIVRDLTEPGAADANGEVSASVRVRVFRGALREHEPEPVAIGYLGHDEHDLAAYEVENPLRELRSKGRELLSGERAQRAKAAARRAARDPRVGYGSAAVLAVLAGWAITRKVRGRRRLS